jgi:hypothetical protein
MSQIIIIRSDAGSAVHGPTASGATIVIDVFDGADGSSAANRPLRRRLSRHRSPLPLPGGRKLRGRVLLGIAGSAAAGAGRAIAGWLIDIFGAD